MATLQMSFGGSNLIVVATTIGITCLYVIAQHLKDGGGEKEFKTVHTVMSIETLVF